MVVTTSPAGWKEGVVEETTEVWCTAFADNCCSTGKALLERFYRSAGHPSYLYWQGKVNKVWVVPRRSQRLRGPAWDCSPWEPGAVTKGQREKIGVWSKASPDGPLGTGRVILTRLLSFHCWKWREWHSVGCYKHSTVGNVGGAMLIGACWIVREHEKSQWREVWMA